jgi:hypothetical protein
MMPNTKNIAHPAWPGLVQQATAQFQQEYDQRNYMINGRRMTFQQFLDEVAPGQSPQRTFLTLK